MDTDSCSAGLDATWRPLLPLAVLCAAILVSCDSGGSSSPPEQEEVSVSTRAVHADSTVNTAVGYYDGEQVTTDGAARKTYPENAEEDMTVRYEADGFIAEDTTVSLGSSHDFDLEMQKDKPDRSSVTFPITESDTSVSADLYIEDTLAVGGASEPTVTVPYGQSPLTARVEGRYFQTETVEFTPDASEKTVPVELARRQIQINVNATDRNSTVGVANPYTDDSSEARASFSGQFPARSGSYIAYGRGRHWETVSKELAAGDDHEVTVDVPSIAVCENDIDDDEDGKADENDPGCLDENGEYEPGDTSEKHVFVRNTRISGGEGNDVDGFVSSAENSRQSFFPGANRVLDLPPSITDAVVAGVRVENKRSGEQSGEAFDGKFKCGPTRDNLNNVNTSGIIEDNNEQDGWALSGFPGVSIEFFETGNFCRIIYRHWTYVEDKPTGDGNDDVFFLKAGDDELRVVVFEFFVEAEDYPADDKQTPASTKRESNCDEGRPCTTAEENGYPQR